MTVTDLVTHCARMIGYLGRGQTLSAAESNAGLDMLNELMGAWNRENLMLFRTARTIVSWPASTTSQTIGSGGNITSPARPDRIVGASWVDTSVTPNLEVPIAVLQTTAQYQNIPQKTLDSTWPLVLYYDPTYDSARGTIYLWPRPSSAISIALYTWGRMSVAWTLNDTISMPDGYQRAMRYNLALELCGVLNMPIPPAIAMMAEESKANIKSLNMTPRPIGADPMAMSVGMWSEGVYNWRSDTFG